MRNQFDSERTYLWINVGRWQGVKNGIQLAYGYMAIPLILVGLGILWQAGVGLNALLFGGESGLFHEPMALIGAGAGFAFFGVLYIGFGTVLGVLPAMVLGALTGAALAAVLSMPHIAPHRWNRLTVGVGMGVVIALMVNSMALRLFSTQTEDNIAPYLFFVGIPSVIFVGYCAWLSANLPTLVAKAQQPREFPVPAYKQIRFTQ